MEYSYSWAIDGIYKVDANKVGHEIEKIGEDVTPKELVKEAEKNKVLNPLFEWDNEIAGEQYRIYQARKILGALKVEIKTDKSEKEDIKIRAFVKTTNSHDDGYKSITTILESPTEYQLMLEKAYKELNNIKNKYTNLTEIQEILKDIPEI